jgi:hypothetical protein
MIASHWLTLFGATASYRWDNSGAIVLSGCALP